jgi:hypothetical protein
MNRLILVVVSILLGWRAVLTVRNDRMSSTLMVIRVAVITVDRHLIPHQVIIPRLATGIRRLIEDTEVNRYKLLTRFRHSLVFIRYFRSRFAPRKVYTRTKIQGISTRVAIVVCPAEFMEPATAPIIVEHRRTCQTLQAAAPLA